MLSDNSRIQLSLIRRKAVRMGVWFRVLTRAERGLVDLTIRCIDKVKSVRLAFALAKTLGKLLNGVRSSFLRRLEQLGRPLAEKISEAAVSWGNTEAVRWRYDISFIRLAGLNSLSWGWK